jgi:hypothetical protein
MNCHNIFEKKWNHGAIKGIKSYCNENDLQEKTK